MFFDDTTRQNLFSKIADKISRNTFINWDGINDDEADELYGEAVSNICFLEEMLDEYGEELTLEEYQAIVSEMMQGYITINLLERREVIEDLIRSI